MLHRRLLALAASLVGLLSFAQAQAQTPAAAELFVRLLTHHETHVIEADGKTVSTYRFATQVLKPEAVENAKQVSLSISRGAQTLQVLEAYTQKAGGKRVAVPKSSWQLRQDSGKGGNAPIFSDFSRTTLVYPEVEAGDTLVLSYRLATREPLFPGKVSLFNEFQRSAAIDDARVLVDAPVAMALKTQAFGMKETVETRGKRRLTTWTYQNREPAADTRRDWSVYDIGTNPGFLVSSFDSWEDVARSYVQRASPKAALTPAIRELAAQLVAGKEDLRERVQAIHEWTATKIDYAGNCVGIGAVVPRDLDVVLKHRIGDCKDHATLLQALLAAQGIESHQVLVNASNIYRLPEVPVASMVNHVINYIPALGLFVDSTDPMTPLGRLPMGLYAKPVLVADARLPTRIPADAGGNTQSMTTKLLIGSDGAVEGSVEVTTTGFYALMSRSRLKGMTQEQRKRFVTEMFRGAGLEADGEFEPDDPQPMNDSFRYKARFRIKKAVRLPGAGSIPISPWFYNEAPAARWAQRALMPVDGVDTVCSSGSSVEVYEITLPQGMEILSVPSGVGFSSPLLNYEASYKLDGRQLNARREVVDKTQPSICPAEVQRSFKAAAETVANDLKQQLLYK